MMDYIPLLVPNLSGNEAKYLKECIDTNFVSSVGPFVEKLQKKVCDVTKSKFAIATCSGTSALHVSLHVLGVGRDDLVIMPSYTFIATANAVKHGHADPWLFDISLNDWCLDPDLLREVLKQETKIANGKVIHKATSKRVSAIIVVYAAGMIANMTDIVSIARKYDLPIVADAAGAIGSRYRGKELGEVGVDVSFLSFNGNKLITTGGGGCVITNNSGLAEKIKHLTTTARCNDDYIHDKIGFNYRMTNLEAAVGCAQLERLQSFLHTKCRIAKMYNKIAEDFSCVLSFPKEDAVEQNNWLAGLVFQSSKDASYVIDFLLRHNIQARKFWFPIHLQKPYADCLKTNQSKVEFLYDKVVTLPCSTNLSEQQIEYIRVMLIKGLSKVEKRCRLKNFV